MSLKPPEGANAPNPNPGPDARTIYCSPTGTGPGTLASFPTTLQKAINQLASPGIILEDTWVVQLAAGTYPAPVWPSSLRSRGYVYIQGPDPGTVTETWPIWNGSTHVSTSVAVPAEPTAIISATAGGDSTRGIRVYNGSKVWIQNIETSGFSVTGLDIDRSDGIQIRNHWDRGSARGRYIKRSSYFSGAGRLINNTTFGVDELFACTGDYKDGGEAYATAAGIDVTTSATHRRNAIPFGTRIINPGKFGLHRKEHSNGHVDYLLIEDAPNAFSLHSQCVANCTNLVIRQGVGNRCSVGVTQNDSEVHSASAIKWGWTDGVTTAAPAVIPTPFLRLGMSNQLDDYWSGDVDDDGAYTTRSGHSPLRPIVTDYADHIFTGTTGDQTIATYTVPAKRLTTGGKQVRLVVSGTLTDSSTGTGTMTFAILVKGVAVASWAVTVPRTNGDHFHLVVELTCTSDGNNQRLHGTFQYGNVVDLIKMGSRTDDFSVASSVAVRLTSPNTGNSVTVKRQEAWF